MVQHGGLARTGKVRNNTPKVISCGGTREVTGRAKKRQQYNKRFNQTLGRKGPNHQGSGMP